jgi:hypothetical protein
MKTASANRRQGLSLRRLAFKARPVAAGCALLLLGAGDLVLAQQAADQQVTVTGIRRGIEAAISVKKNADGVVEAISAEDIGKLPDNSIAESIARLPGLAAQRVAGRAQVISVRGLSPDFATTLLNGREVVSTGDNRSVEFDQYPSELLSGVVVYKTPYADLVGQGLSGTIDMQTVRPLNFSNRVVVVNARYQENSLGAAANAKGSGNRLSASYIDQFANRTVGVSLGFAHLETPVQEEQTGMYEPWFANPTGAANNQRPGVAPGAYMTDGIKALRRTGVSKRDGLMGTIEWKASKDWTSVLDLFASKASQEDTANQLESHLFYNGDYPCKPACNWSATNVNGNNTLTGGTVANVYPLVRGMYNKREDEIKAVGWNNAFKLGEIKLVADLNWSKATRNELSLENNTQLLPAKQLDTLKLNFASNGFSTMTPGLNYSDPSKLFLTNSIYGSGYGKVPKVEDELTGLKLVAKLPTSGSVAGIFADIDLGLNYADRSKKKHQPEGNINIAKDTAIASDLQYSPVDLGFAGAGIIPAWNVPGAVGRYMTFNPSETSAAYLIAKAWNVYEKTTTGFVQGNIDTQWGGVPVRGNLGLQIVRTDQSSTSNYWDGTAPAGQEIKPFTDGKTYTDVLPSLNLAFGLGNDQTVRFLHRQAGRQRRQPAPRPLACQCTGPVVREVLRHQGLCRGGRVLQGLEELHLHPVAGLRLLEVRRRLRAGPGQAAGAAAGHLDRALQRPGWQAQRAGAVGVAALQPVQQRAAGLRHPGQRQHHQQQRQDQGPRERHQRGGRPDRAAGLVEERQQPDLLLRKKWFRGPDQPTQAFGLHRRDRQLQRQPDPALRGGRERRRCPARLHLQRRQPEGPGSAGAGQQPHRPGLPDLRRHQGPAAGEHQVGPHRPAGCQLQVLSLAASLPVRLPTTPPQHALAGFFRWTTGMLRP